MPASYRVSKTFTKLAAKCWRCDKFVQCAASTWPAPKCVRSCASPSVCLPIRPFLCLSVPLARFLCVLSLSVSVSPFGSLALPLALFVVCALCVRTFNCNWILITALSAKNVAVARLADRADRADSWTDGQAERDRQTARRHNRQQLAATVNSNSCCCHRKLKIHSGSVYSPALLFSVCLPLCSPPSTLLLSLSFSLFLQFQFQFRFHSSFAVGAIKSAPASLDFINQQAIKVMAW